jgi:hypothetical protein
MTNQATHSVELRQNGEIVATVEADIWGNARDLNLFRSLDASVGLCGVCLDVYEGDTQLRFDSINHENGAAIFHGANGKARLVLCPGKLGLARVDISESSIDGCVRLKPLSVN